MSSLAYVANDRTISLEPLVEYLEKIDNIIKGYEKTYEEEKQKNEPLQYSYQTWTRKDLMVNTSYDIGRVDGGNVKYSSIHELKNALLYQASSIRNIYLYLTVRYNGEKVIDLNFTIYDHGFKFEYDINEAEQEVQKITDEFIAKIEAMPLKLDRIVKSKNVITMKVGFGMGMIPAIILGVVSLFVPPMFELYRQYFFALPVLMLALGFIFGMFMGGAKLGSSYSKIIPTKYGGWDSRTRSSYRVDDMEKFTGEVDVLIGKKAGLAAARQYIARSEKLLQKFILPELAIVAAISLIAFLIILISGGK